MAGGGASFKRDATDTRVMNEVANGLAPVRASNGTTKGGLIDTQSDVGGWDTYTYNTSEILTDSDADGMPDSWENARGLAPNNPADRNSVASSGYTNLEEYINGILLGETTAVKSIKANIHSLNVWPNPVKGTSHVVFSLAQPANVTLTLNDISGKQITVLANSPMPGGESKVELNGDMLKAGIYILTILDGSNNKSHLKVVVK